MIDADERPLTIISSDGHATAQMRDYRWYLERRYQEDFDSFLVEWEARGSRNFDPPALLNRLDPEDVMDWKVRFLDAGRLEGVSDASIRIAEMEREGFVAEILFPDFGLPFQLLSSAHGAAEGYEPPNEEHLEAGRRAFNRWLADFIQVDPNRFVGVMFTDWRNVESAVAEIERARGDGLKALVLPAFPAELPLYHHRYDPLWSTAADLDITIHVHSGLSSCTDARITTPGIPHPASSSRIFGPQFYFNARNILSHLIWGAVFERYPRLRVVFTELQSAWIPQMLQDMDYSYAGSFARSDIRAVIPLMPSEYFERQCFIGSSLFSKREIQDRHRIGLHKMMLAMDYPHHEGTILGTTRAYLRATLGEVGVPVDEARRLLGETAASVYGFDLAYLDELAAKVNLVPRDVLTPPEADVFPRGDVHRPGLIA